ncbi:MAG TPA: hypothetical protein VFF79_12945 [Conexibacter sp.]|nr:hypothetical protein [Conexibacter sp.]
MRSAERRGRIRRALIAAYERGTAGDERWNATPAVDALEDELFHPALVSPEPGDGDELRELLTGAARHLRNLPGTRESDDIRWAERLERRAARLSSREQEVADG